MVIALSWSVTPVNDFLWFVQTENEDLSSYGISVGASSASSGYFSEYDSDIPFPAQTGQGFIEYPLVLLPFTLAEGEDFQVWSHFGHFQAHEIFPVVTDSES